MRTIHTHILDLIDLTRIDQRTESNGEKLEFEVSKISSHISIRHSNSSKSQTTQATYTKTTP